MKSGPAAVDQVALMDKWSLKPADHNAIRVRNNQRRHRARVKSRVEELEARMERTSAELKAALSTISVLTAELEALRGSKASSTHHVGPPAVPAPPLAAAPSLPITPPSSLQSPETDLSQPLDFQQTPPTGVPTSSPDLDIVIAATPAAVDDNMEEGANCDCQGLPPSAPGESMMSCDLAFQIVKEQNHSGLEVATIRSWLGPGFRKALRPGGTCRVETNRLYEILDLITSSGEAAGQLLHPY